MWKYEVSVIIWSILLIEGMYGACGEESGKGRYLGSEEEGLSRGDLSENIENNIREAPDLENNDEGSELPFQTVNEGGKGNIINSPSQDEGEQEIEPPILNSDILYNEEELESEELDSIEGMELNENNEDKGENEREGEGEKVEIEKEWIKNVEEDNKYSQSEEIENESEEIENESEEIENESERAEVEGEWINKIGEDNPNPNIIESQSEEVEKEVENERESENMERETENMETESESIKVISREEESEEESESELYPILSNKEEVNERKAELEGASTSLINKEQENEQHGEGEQEKEIETEGQKGVLNNTIEKEGEEESKESISKDTNILPLEDDGYKTPKEEIEQGNKNIESENGNKENENVEVEKESEVGNTIQVQESLGNNITNTTIIPNNQELDIANRETTIDTQQQNPPQTRNSNYLYRKYYIYIYI